MIHPHQDIDRRSEVAAHQHPSAQVFSCIDSRVAPEIVFDHGPGDLFVIRTGVQTLDELVQGSAEFGPLVYGMPLGVVLGRAGRRDDPPADRSHRPGAEGGPAAGPPLIGKGRLLIQGAYYSLDTGEVTW